MYPPMLTFGVTVTFSAPAFIAMGLLTAPAQLPELKPRFTATSATEVQAGAAGAGVPEVGP